MDKQFILMLMLVGTNQHVSSRMSLHFKGKTNDGVELEKFALQAWRKECSYFLKLLSWNINGKEIKTTEGMFVPVEVTIFVIHYGSL